MKIIVVENRNQLLIDNLFTIWEKSVKATHTFLSDSEIEKIAKFVTPALTNISHLIIASKNKTPIAFMGIEKQKLEMLFVLPNERGKSVGKQLLLYAIETFNVIKLDVNEQNPQAKDFYEHMGFHVYERTKIDEQGAPYPLLHMKYYKNNL